ncbi:MAG: nucleotidyltransferase domain-containing protein [Thermodesulfovibrionales bacterium]|nr:nucleotidyltransferase domain-containing protein [Thermodesulfovibrionales bacterium]
MRDKAEISSRLRSYLEPRGERIFAYIHGSFQEDIPFRDIDIALYLDESIVPEEELEYCLELSVRTEMDTRIMPLDIRALNHATWGFRYHATKGILLFSKDDEVRKEFLEETWKRYFDLLPKRREIILDLLS